jgi:hypothetical protein
MAGKRNWQTAATAPVAQTDSGDLGGQRTAASRLTTTEAKAAAPAPPAAMVRGLGSRCNMAARDDRTARWWGEHRYGARCRSFALEQFCHSFSV